MKGREKKGKDIRLGRLVLWCFHIKGKIRHTVAASRYSHCCFLSSERKTFPRLCRCGPALRARGLCPSNLTPAQGCGALFSECPLKSHDPSSHSRHTQLSSKTLDISLPLKEASKCLFLFSFCPQCSFPFTRSPASLQLGVRKWTTFWTGKTDQISLRAKLFRGLFFPGPLLSHALLFFFLFPPPQFPLWYHEKWVIGFEVQLWMKSHSIYTWEPKCDLLWQ